LTEFVTKECSTKVCSWFFAFIWWRCRFVETCV